MSDFSVIILNEMDSASMAAGTVGAGLLTAGVYAFKKSRLRKQQLACQGDPKCVKRVQDKLDDLKKFATRLGLVGAGSLVVGVGQGLAIRAARHSSEY